MAFGFKSFLKGIRLVPVSTTAITQIGDLEVLSASGKLNYFNGTASPIVTEAHSATLTNKVMSGSSNTFSNIGYSSLILTNSIVNADINSSAAIAYSKLNLVGQILNADISASAAIARNKLASGSANHVIINDGSGVFSSEATLAKSRGGSGQDNSSITFPASGTLTTNAGVETLSNKSFSDPITLAEVATPSTPSSGNGKIYFKSDGFLYQLNDDGTETKVGAGSGGINYITNSDAESNTTGWATYADAAGSAPVDGTGGSANITLTRSTSSPLRGTGSFLITKDAANRQGQGTSYDFTIADADKAKSLAISFNYTISSGTFVAGDSSDIRVYLYDVTNAQLIQPAPYTIQGGAGSNHRFLGTFQTASNSNSYRLILHIATTSASAYSFKFDDVSVGPQMLNYGSPVTDWVSYTPTIGGLGTGSATAIAKYRRVGDSIQIQANITKDGSAGSGGSPVTVSIPSGLTSDSNKVGGSSSRANIGAAIYVTGNFTSTIHAALLNTVTNTIVFGNVSTGSEFLGADFAASRNIYFEAIVPITGWSSTVEMSNDTDTRVCVASYENTAGTLIGSAAIVPFSTKIFDTHSSVSGSGTSWVFTAPISGFYKVSVNIQTDSTGWNGGNNLLIDLYKNNVFYQRLGLKKIDATISTEQSVNGSGIVQLNAGNTIAISIESSQAVNLSTNAGRNNVSIERISGPSAIAASETVAARYRTSAGQSIPNNTPTIIDYGTRDYDTHGACTTGSSWKFTAPTAGKYSVSARAYSTNGGGWSLSETWKIYVYKNGSIWGVLGGTEVHAAHSQRMEANGNTDVILNAGDFIDIRIIQNSGAPVSLQNDGDECHVSIHKIGGGS